MPSSGRQLGSFATIGSAVYYSGGGFFPVSGDPALLEVYYGPAVAVTASPTPGPSYVYGTAGSNTCPVGSTRVTDWTVCEQAAAALGLSWNGFGFATDPKGCYKSGTYDAYFNDHATGGTACTYCQLICLGAAVATTPAPMSAPTIGPCAVAAPTNGNLGSCTSALAAGAQCQPTCNPGYGVSGPMDCSATGVLTSASVCGTKQWASRNGLPTSSINSGQSCAAVGSLLYVYTQPAFQKYAAATDAWETGACRVPPALCMSHALRGSRPLLFLPVYQCSG
jgi:hypothetical protein